MMKSDDLISRAAACECIGKMIHEYREKGEYALADGMILARRYGIKCLPAVDAVPVVHARWLECEDGWGDCQYQCSECGGEWCLNDCTPEENGMKFCPNCGAKMDGEART